MRTRLPFLGFLILGLVLFYLFFLWQFPYAQLKNKMVQAFEGTTPLTLSIGRVGPSFPAGLEIQNIRISSDSLSVHVPDLIFHPGILSFFLGKTEWTVEGAGRLSRARIGGRFQEQKNQYRLNVRLNQVEVQASSPRGFSFSLKLSGEANLQWEGENWEGGKGQAWALLERSAVQGDQPSQAPLPLLLFDTLRTEVQLQDGIVRVGRLEASGKDRRFSLPKDFQFSLKGGFPSNGGIFIPLFPG
jgi:type II secretion system protein N